MLGPLNRSSSLDIYATAASSLFSVSVDLLSRGNHHVCHFLISTVDRAQLMIWKILMEKADTVEQTMNHKHAVPDDGHAWKKYGQKFIKRTAMNRSYFRCQKTNCKAKKRADWGTSQSSVEVLYDGEHSHPPPNSSAAADDSISGNPSASRVNQYNLLNQVFGNGSPSDPQP